MNENDWLIKRIKVKLNWENEWMIKLNWIELNVLISLKCLEWKK